VPYDEGVNHVVWLQTNRMGLPSIPSPYSTTRKSEPAHKEKESQAEAVKLFPSPIQPQNSQVSARKTQENSTNYSPTIVASKASASSDCDMNAARRESRKRGDSP
jgi:hypothetical protein